MPDHANPEPVGSSAVDQAEEGWTLKVCDSCGRATSPAAVFYHAEDCPVLRDQIRLVEVVSASALTRTEKERDRLEQLFSERQTEIEGLRQRDYVHRQRAEAAEAERDRLRERLEQIAMSPCVKHTIHPRSCSDEWLCPPCRARSSLSDA